jgi:hypothetical protein
MPDSISGGLSVSGYGQAVFETIVAVAAGRKSGRSRLGGTRSRQRFTPKRGICAPLFRRTPHRKF